MEILHKELADLEVLLSSSEVFIYVYIYTCICINIYFIYRISGFESFIVII
jgi:hypothetical protein